MKKIAITITIFIFFSAIGFGVYFAWQKSKEILEPPKTVEQTIDYSLPSQAVTVERLKILSDQPVFAYWPATFAVDATSTLNELLPIFYINLSGQILKVNENEDEIISDRIIDNLQSVEVGKDGKMIIVKYGFRDAPQFELFNLEKKIWQPLTGISAAAFSPDGLKIAYFENIKNSAASNLAMKDLFGAKPKTTKILSFNQKDFNLKWLTADKILLVSRSSYQMDSEIWEVNIGKKTLRLFAGDGGLAINWAKDASIGMQFSANKKGEGRLNLIGNDGSIKANLSFFTLPDKCLIGLSKIYCAIPQSYNTVKSPVLPDDYLKREAYSDDKIYEINVNENSFLEIPFDPQISVDAVDFSLVSNQLFFLNRYDNKVYSLEL